MLSDKQKASAFWLLLSAIFAAFLVGFDFTDAHGSKGRGLAIAQSALRWLIVEPLGPTGAVALVLLLGLVGAFLTWPHNRGDER